MSNPKAHDDPRDPSLEIAFETPKTWYRSSNEGLSMSGMLLSGLIMVTRNRFLAWPSVLFGINTLINSHPMRTKDGGSGWSNVALCFSALVASYLPLFLINGKTSLEV